MQEQIEQTVSPDEKPSRRLAVGLTDHDRSALDLIKATGFVGITPYGIPVLEGERQITSYRLRRLEALGFVAANNDRLLEEAPTQTYRIVEPENE